ncbi:hypothetical protein BDB01DRAFT_781271 [Pilobolus umbonatus]|nr:hypothetical protein BDB01DRAFT_781271 [Pilobolus umbonatus]
MDTMSFEWLIDNKNISVIDPSLYDGQDTCNASHCDMIQYLFPVNKEDLEQEPHSSPGVNSSHSSPDNNNDSGDMNSGNKPLIFEEQISVEQNKNKHIPFDTSNVTIIQNTDNFVTFMPLTPVNTPSSNKRKTNFNKSIFVTESPQSICNRKKRTLNSDNYCGGGSEEEADEYNAGCKRMTVKERRLMRNKISARNFRVRRKEYITELEEKVQEQEKMIESLQAENTQLKAANEELTEKLISPPSLLPNFSSSQELSLSEGIYSPLRDISSFPFQPSDAFNILDESNNHYSYYLSYTTLPDWDMHQILGEKSAPIPQQSPLSIQTLMTDYPLLAPALMSIIIRHTLSLEYVVSMVNEFKSDIIPLIKTDEEEVEENEDRGELVQHMMTDYFPHFVNLRGRGLHPKELLNKCKDNLTKHTVRHRLWNSKKSSKKLKENKTVNRFDTLHNYCKVAGTLLRHPHRMAEIDKVLGEKIGFRPRPTEARRITCGLPNTVKI